MQIKGSAQVQRRRQCLKSHDNVWKGSQVQFVSQQELQTFILHDHCYDFLSSENIETDNSSRKNIKSEDDMSPNDKSCQTDLSGEDIDELIKTKTNLVKNLKTKANSSILFS